MLADAFKGAGLTAEHLDELARLTGPTDGRTYGLTYSDLTTRFVPEAVLDALPDRPLTFDRLTRIAADMTPTPPFATDGAGTS